MLARVAGGLTQIVLCAERMREAVEIRHSAALAMKAEMMKGALDAALPDRDAVKVQLQSWPSQKVRVRRARESLDLEIELHDESRRIDEGAETPGRGVVLRERGLHIGVMHTRVNADGSAICRRADAQ